MKPGTGPYGLFQVVRLESLLKSPVQLTWTPKYATVDSNAKFQLGYPMVLSPRLLAKAKPKTSPKSLGLFGAASGSERKAVIGADFPGAELASNWEACCITGGPLSLNFRSTALSGIAEVRVDTVGGDACTGPTEIRGTAIKTVAATKWRSQRLDIGKTTGTLGPTAYQGQIKGCKRN